MSPGWSNSLRHWPFLLTFGLNLHLVFTMFPVFSHFQAFGGATALRFTYAVPEFSSSGSAGHGDEEPNLQTYTALSETFMDIVFPNQGLTRTKRHFFRSSVRREGVWTNFDPYEFFYRISRAECLWLEATLLSETHLCS